MDDILAKKNKHLFLEEKDNTHNSFISNINYAVENIDTIKTFNDNVNSGTMQHLLETYIEQVGTEGNAWVVKLTELGESILATTSGFNYAAVLTVNQDIAAGATITLPEAMKYRVGTHMLLVSWNGTVCYNNEQYEEVGSFNEKSTVIKIKQDIKTGDKLEFRTVALADTASVTLALGDAITSYAFPINSSNIERTLIERFSDIVNVKDFGAKGDGITDDADAFEACIAYASLDGNPKTIDLCGDSYVISKTIVIEKDGITIQNGTVIAKLNGSWTIASSELTPTIDPRVFIGGNEEASTAIYKTYIYEALPMFRTTGDNEGFQGVRDKFINIKLECNGVASGFNTNGFATVYKDIFVEHMGENGYGILVEPGANQTLLSNCQVHQVNYSEERAYSSFTADGVVISCGDVVINDSCFWLCRTNYVHYAVGPVQATNLHLWQDGVDTTVSNETVRTLNPNAEFYTSNASIFNNLYLDNGAMIFRDTTRVVINTCYALRDFNRIPSDYIPFRFITTSANRPLYGFKISNLHYLYDSDHSNQMFSFETEGTNASWVDGIENLESVQDLDCTSWFGAKTVVNNHSANKEVLKLFHLTGDECHLQMRAKGEGDVKYHAKIIDDSEGLSLAVKNPSVKVFQVLNTPVGNCTAKLIGRYETGQTSGLIMCNSTGTKTASLRMATDDGSGSSFFRITFDGTDTVNIASYGIVPVTDNVLNLGGADKRFKNVFAATGSIQTSDERLKEQIEAIPEEVLRAWGDVDFTSFKFRDSVEEKGELARIHTGIIAQRISDAFEAHGLDASKYGLFCYDEWKDKYEEQEVIDAEAVVDEDGNVVEPARMHTERNLVQSAGNRFGVRYEEALVLECAYQRWLGEQRDAKIEALMQRISALENNR